ncbi:MAG: SoxR reducing system RseC family protein [Gammaproteobacteria bacterium]|nr:SoxR reducing system RseC family protein [Gammaproteobacteria bacterium]
MPCCRHHSSGWGAPARRAQIRVFGVSPRLSRVGAVRRVGASCSVVFDCVRCAGCNGCCGVSVGGGEVPLDFEVPNGTPVEVVASAHDLARLALRCFGWPLGAVGAAAFAAEWVAASEALIAAALFGTALAVVGVRAATVWLHGLVPWMSGRSGTRGESLRVVPRG